MRNKKFTKLKERHNFINRIMARAAFGFAILSLYGVSIPALREGSVKYWIVGFWALIPAIWLFYEWFYLLKPAIAAKETERDLELDIATHEQSVVRAMWAAYFIVVVAFYQVSPFDI